MSSWNNPGGLIRSVEGGIDIWRHILGYIVEWDIYVEVVSIPGATGAKESDLDLDKQQPGGKHVLLPALYTLSALPYNVYWRKIVRGVGNIWGLSRVLWHLWLNPVDVPIAYTTAIYDLSFHIDDYRIKVQLLHLSHSYFAPYHHHMHQSYTYFLITSTTPSTHPSPTHVVQREITLYCGLVKVPTLYISSKYLEFL